MATVLLGFEDEIVGEHHNGQLNLTVDKIGGKPDYPSNVDLEPPVCPLCRLPRPLVVQMYSPLDSTIFHRTLFLFACINPNCWNLSESWICIRVQAKNSGVSNAERITADPKTSPMDWCAEADEWGDDNSNLSEENGNVINNSEKVSDEDDESSSSNSLQSGFQNLTVDDRNANQGAEGGAVGRQSSSASAELEGNDDGVAIFVDTPTYPQRDITALLHEATPLPQDIVRQSEKRGGPPAAVQFTPYFVSVWEEPSENQASGCASSDKHVKELLLEYQQRNEGGLIALGESDALKEGKGTRREQQSREDVYETSCPAHGDKMFHHFLSKVQANRGQIFRYSRDSSPLLLYPLIEQPKECRYCKGKVVFEFQLIPTIISKLRLSTDHKQVARLEFGTVLVYTCQRSCWSSDTTFRLETVILQKEVN